MRVGVVASFVCLCFVGVCQAQSAQASIRKDVNIPAEPLGAALQDLAKTYDLQLLYHTEIAKDLKTQGAIGLFTPDDALNRVLSGTGLTYKFLDSRTITVFSAAPSGSDSQTTSDDSSKSSAGGGKRSSQDFRLAQVDQGKASNASSIANQTANSQENPSGQSTGLSEIIVTAQKRSERMQDVPMSISVLGGKELDSSTFSGVTDALNTVPSVAAFSNQFQAAGTQLSFRGVSAAQTFSGGASTVGYYVDSVPFGMIRSSLVPDPNVYDLSRIEVLRGPQGTLYGANALVGVIRVLTNDPDLNEFDFKARGSVSTTEGGGANYGGDMAVNLPILDGTLAARAVLGEDHESGWIDGPLGNDINYGDLGNARLKVRWQATDALSVDLSAWHSQESYNALSIADNNGRTSATYPQPSYTQFNAYGAKVDYELPLVSISSMTSYVGYTSNNLLDANPVIPNIDLGTNFTSRVYSEEMDLASKLDGPWKWTAGAMYRDDKDTLYQPGFSYPDPVPSGIFDNEADTSRSAAVYGELGRRFFDDTMQATIGLRYFHDDESNYPLQLLPAFGITSFTEREATSSATTPRAILTWLPNREFTAYASYSQGFRSGAPQSALVGAAVPDYPAVKPDRLINYEIGVKGTLWNQRLSYEAAVFHMKWEDIQQTLNILTPNAGYTPVFLNAGSASGNGAEFTLRVQPVDGLLFSTDFGWNDLHFDHDIYSGGSLLFPEGSRPNDSPEYTAGLTAQYTFSLGSSGLKGVFSASGNYVSPLNVTYFATGLSAENSLLLTKGSFRVQFPKKWTLSIFADNINNYNGTQYPILGIAQWGARQRPRTYGLQIEYR